MQGPVFSFRELYFLLNMGDSHTFDPAAYKSYSWVAPVYLAIWFSFS